MMYADSNSIRRFISGQPHTSLIIKEVWDNALNEIYVMNLRMSKLVRKCCNHCKFLVFNSSICCNQPYRHNCNQHYCHNNRLNYVNKIVLLILCLNEIITQLHILVRNCYCSLGMLQANLHRRKVVNKRAIVQFYAQSADVIFNWQKRQVRKPIM